MKKKSTGRGFAGMTAERHREVCSMGGKAVPGVKRSFSQNRKLAAAAGRIGGQSVPPERRSFATNRQLAAAAGRKGGTNVSPERRPFSQSHELAVSAGAKGGAAEQKAQ